MSARAPLLAVALLAALAASGPLAGCSDAVDPTVGTDQAFSVYGYLDPTADRQALRVVPITGTLEADTARTIDAEVTSVEPATGRTAVWRDSVVTYDDGTVGHVFVADYTPTDGAAVEVSVAERSGDRRRATVTVDVPALARPTVAAPTLTGSEVTYPLRVDAPRVLAAELVYYVSGWPAAPDDTVAVPYRPSAGFTDAGGAWALDLGFVGASRAFLASREVGGARLALVEVAVRTFVADAGWAVPDGGFDEDQIVEPGTFSNVGGGFGFVGAGYWTEARWTPSLVTQSRAGFVVAQDPASAPFINEVSADGWVELYNPTLELVPIGGYGVEGGSARVDVPFGTTVGPGAFWVAEVGFDPSTDAVALLDPEGERVLELELPGLPEGDLGTYGAYPDGRSRKLGELDLYRDVDLFRGLTRPTPGAPNELGAQGAVVNEVYTAGPDGWAELFFLSGVPGALVTSDADAPVTRWRFVDAGPDGLGSATETAGVLDLEQVGGEVVVAYWPRDNPPRVVDVRPYGPQAQARSSGLLPDGNVDSWQTGLVPTRDAPNTTSRFARR